MLIHVKGFAHMRQYTTHLPSDGALEVPGGMTVAQVLDLLGVPSEPSKLIFVNGRPQSPGHVLGPGDSLVFFPPLEGG
jgi:sulfur carrier protein ThiS